MGSCVGSVRQQYVKPSGWVIHAVFVLFTLLSSGMHVILELAPLPCVEILQTNVVISQTNVEILQTVPMADTVGGWAWASPKSQILGGRPPFLPDASGEETLVVGTATWTDQRQWNSSTIEHSRESGWRQNRELELATKASIFFGKRGKVPGKDREEVPIACLVLVNSCGPNCIDNNILSKPALDHVPPFVFAIFRLSFAMPFLFLTTLKEKRVELTWKDNGHLMLIGLGGVGVAQSVIFVANKLVGAGILSMMIPLLTILTVVMSGCLGMERVGPLKGFGVMLSVFGSVAIAYFSENDFHADTTWGVGFMFLQASGWSSYLILMSKFLDRKPIPMYAYFRAVLWGYLYMLPFAIYQMIQVTWSEVPYWVYLSEMYCGILVSSGAHVMMSWLIQHCSALLPASYTCLQPLSTVSLALLFLGETFNIWLIICMFSILSGLALIIFARAQEQKQAKLSKGSADEDEQEPLLPEDPANSTSDVQGNSASVAVKVVEEAA